MPSNGAALALYRRMGLCPKYSAKSLRLPWSLLDALPSGTATVEIQHAQGDAAVERAFDLPRGQLANARTMGRLILVARSREGRAGPATGLAIFDAKFPGAFPFRVRELGALRPLLEAMRRYVPSDVYINLVAEDDERLVALLTDAGASLRHDILHLEGAL
jgi:hypothetical protein